MKLQQMKMPVWRIRIFLVTWLAYFGFYFCRKNLSIANTGLQTEYGFTNSDFALIVGIYSLMYMIGQYLNGYLSDRFGPRLIVGAGLIISVVANLIFGISATVAVLSMLAGLNGLGQSSGWSGLVKNMSSWFKKDERGVVMSWWSTCYVVGGFMGTLFATYWLSNQTFWPELGLKRVFWAPAVVLGIIALIYVLFTRNKPDNNTAVDQNSDTLVVNEEQDTISIKGMLKNSALWVAALMYFFIKFTRYTYLFWLPTFLEQALGYSTEQAGYTSSVYEFVGFGGVIAAGYLSDKVFGSQRFPVGSLMLFGLTIAFILQPFLTNMGMVATAIGIGLIGFLTYGPDSLMSGAAAMDLGTEKGAAKAAGFINGVGSAGQLLSPFVVAFVSEEFGWSVLFKVFIFTSLISAILLATKWNYGKKTTNDVIRNIENGRGYQPYCQSK
ncbi:MAG: MFS transporter [Carboxylicivirga sp.]|jgi:sugar phosphate permease|nr:MFS transporter [Carboxylicivirga sp.]